MKKRSSTAMTQEEFLKLFSRRYPYIPKAMEVKIIPAATSSASKKKKMAMMSSGASQSQKQGNVEEREGVVEGEEEDDEVMEPITFKQYFRLSMKAGLPFVAFGFVDNGIMLSAGDRIEATLGKSWGKEVEEERLEAY
jgi:hypothetical protein